MRSYMGVKWEEKSVWDKKRGTTEDTESRGPESKRRDCFMEEEVFHVKYWLEDKD